MLFLHFPVLCTHCSWQVGFTTWIMFYYVQYSYIHSYILVYIMFAVFYHCLNLYKSSIPTGNIKNALTLICKPTSWTRIHSFQDSFLPYVAVVTYYPLLGPALFCPQKQRNTNVFDANNKMDAMCRRRGTRKDKRKLESLIATAVCVCRECVSLVFVHVHICLSCKGKGF